MKTFLVFLFIILILIIITGIFIFENEYFLPTLIIFLSTTLGFFGFLVRHYKLATAVLEDGKPDKESRKKSVFFTIESGNIAFLVSNGTHKKTIINMKGYDIDSNGNIFSKVRSTDPLFYGVYWKGFPSFVQKHEWSIPIEREVATVKGKANIGDYIKIEGNRIIDELRWRFPRPFIVMDAEQLGNLAVSAVISLNLEVINPFTAVFLKKADFFLIIYGYISSAYGDLVKSMNQEEYRMMDKTTPNGVFSIHMMNSLNNILRTETGIIITSCVIRESQYSDDATKELAELKIRTIKEGEASIEKARLLGQALIAKATAEAEAKDILGSKEMIDVTKTIRELIKQGVSADVAALIVGGVAEMKRATSEGSKISTLVTGGGINTSIPIGDKK